jgi:hypothetical protein
MLCSTTILRLLTCITEAIQVTGGRMYASPALCHFRNTRSQCLSGRNENNQQNCDRDSWFPSGHETQNVQNTCMLYATSQYGHLPITQSFMQQNSFWNFSYRPVRTLCIYPPSPVLFHMCASSFNPSPLLPQRQSIVSPPGQLSMTTLLGASRRFFWKRMVWMWSADEGTAT